MFKKLLVLSLGLTIFSNVWADDLEEAKARYNHMSLEEQETLKKSFRAKGWNFISSGGGEFESYVHYDYVKPLANGNVEAWLKVVVINDLTKDGLSLGDYTMELVQYNCNNRTLKTISYTDYSNKTGKVINTYTFPSYKDFQAVIPETVGESRLEGACLMNYIKTH